MKFRNVTNENLILLNKDFKTREEVLKELCEVMEKEGIVSSSKEFSKAVWEREEISETGFDNGIAIPHGKSNVVKKPGFAVAKVTKPINNWPSIQPNNKIELIFLLAVPNDNSGTHLRLLSSLSTRLMDETIVNKLKNSNNAESFLNVLCEDEEKNMEVQGEKETIIVLTSCSAGIAHTYMAAEALTKAGNEMGVRVLSEKQGANGIEDRVTKEEIREAKAVIFATDLPPKGKERFNGKPYVQTNVSEPLKDSKRLIEKALNNPDGVLKLSEDNSDIVENNSNESFLKILYKAVSTGISYMIPVIVAGGLMMGIGQLGASFFGLEQTIAEAQYATDSNEIIVILHYLQLFGNMIMKFMYPVFGAFMAYSIADRPGLVPGFIGGAFAAGLHFTLWNEPAGIPSGFFGALILGSVAGYVSNWLNKKIKLHKNLQAMKPMLIVPGISILILFFLNFYVVDPVFGGFNKFLQDLIIEYQSSGTIILSVIIAALTAFDLGGPVNKSAGAVAIGLAADHIFPLTPRVMSIVIPPIGIGLATILDKYIVKERVFNENQRVTGMTSLILGFLAIGEGAIPFMLQNPIITVSINVIGAIIGSLTGVLLGAVQWYPLPAVWGWPLVENILPYLLGLFVGIMFIALANIFVRYYMLVKKRKES